jgi:hypothetical protein
MSSTIIHDILQANIHFINKNIQDTDVEPIVRDYVSEPTGSFLQKLLQDEYTTTRKVLKYQLSQTMIPNIAPEIADTEFLIQGNVLLPNTNHKLGNEMHDLLSTSCPESLSLLRSFEKAFHSLVIHKRSPNISSMILGSHGNMNISIPECFEILQTVFRLSGVRQFISFILNQISSFIHKEEDISEVTHFAEIGALTLGIIGGSSAIEYLFQTFMPIFLYNWMQLSKPAIQLKPHSTTMQRIMKTYHYHSTAQVYAYFSVLAALYHYDCSTLLEVFLLKQCQLFSTLKKIPTSRLPTLYFIIESLQICSLIPTIMPKFSRESKKIFAQIALKFNCLDAMEVQNSEAYELPDWILRLFN